MTLGTWAGVTMIPGYGDITPIVSAGRLSDIITQLGGGDTDMAIMIIMVTGMAERIMRMTGEVSVNEEVILVTAALV